MAMMQTTATSRHVGVSMCVSSTKEDGLEPGRHGRTRGERATEARWHLVQLSRKCSSRKHESRTRPGSAKSNVGSH